MFLNLIPNPKNSPEEQEIAPQGPNKCKRGPKSGRIKNKKIGLYFQNEILLCTKVGFKKLLNLTPSQKNSPEEPKKCTKGPKFG